LGNCEQPQGLQSRKFESHKVKQKKEEGIEDRNAAAVVYANYSKDSRSNAKMPEMPEERGRGRRGEERRADALHRNGAGWSSGTPTAGMGDQNRRGFPFVSARWEENWESSQSGRWFGIIRRIRWPGDARQEQRPGAAAARCEPWRSAVAVLA